MDEPVESAQAVVDHHSPQHVALPEHGLEGIQLARVAALAEDPVVDAEGHVALGRQCLRIRLGLQVASSLDELPLADVVATAVGVVEEDGGRAADELCGAGQVRRHGLEAIQVELPGLEHIAVGVAFVALLRRDRALAVRKIAEQRIKQGPATLGVPEGTAHCGRHGQLCLAQRGEQRA
jgi:hypothetical protein